ncbi:MAG: exosortase H [Planctomycetota bacterium]
MSSTAVQSAQRKQAIRRFILLFLGLFLAFEVILYTVLVSSGIYQSHLDWNARVSGRILSLFLENIVVTRNHIQSPAFSITVGIGCDAIQPAAVFLAGVLSFPVQVRAKVIGAVAGALIISAVNLVRIVSLYFLGLYRPDLFELAHVEVWQGLFIVLALVLWILWVRWADRPLRAASGGKEKGRAS